MLYFMILITIGIMFIISAYSNPRINHWGKSYD